jgi:single-strand DNA-binding protein
MQTRSWDDKTSGEKKYRTEVVADRVQFGPKGGGGGAKRAEQPDEEVASGSGIEYPKDDINPDDIPF